MKLKNKTAVITGGSKGLGKALALRFAVEGANVAICSRSEDNLTKARIELHSKGANVLALQCDIADAEQPHQFVQKVIEEFGTIDTSLSLISPFPPGTELLKRMSMVCFT
ncbi:MAG: SDR family NAD(P)-dependent oxidoreductase [Ignavibacteriales bacterium]|nr:SDR family NAD(P)-dependent oxidoreductase [Ignavibacteriales bacterium]